MSDSRSTKGEGADDNLPPALGIPQGKSGPKKHEACPHCGTTAVIEPSSTLRFVCGVCGKARVPIDDPEIVRTFKEKDELAQATLARNASRTWLALSFAGFGFGFLSLMFVTLVAFVAKPPSLALLVAYLVALLPAVMGVLGRTKGKAHEAKIAGALESGWSKAAHDVVVAKGTGSSKDVAALMRVNEDVADRLLARLSVESDVTTRISDENAELTFESNAPRLRVKPDDEPAPDDVEEEAAPAKKKAEL